MNNPKLSKSEIISYLDLSNDPTQLFSLSANLRRKFVGKEVYFRGLIELSNECDKDCLYCGIRQSNVDISRYSLSLDEVKKGISQSYENQFGSVVIQSGEKSDSDFVNYVDEILRWCKDNYPQLAITLSCGEQSYKTYQRWHNLGATRYLLRIETANEKLFSEIHPQNADHSYKKRLNCLFDLKKAGYQVGSGVMIGLPGQTVEMLADDLLFLEELDIDMCGMGPYIEHDSTPLYQITSKEDLLYRADLTLRMVAILRILLPDINIAATTALETISSYHRFKAFDIGANVIMPNLTPRAYHADYLLYNGKHSLMGDGESIIQKLNSNIKQFDLHAALNLPGTSPHFTRRQEGSPLC